MIKFDLNKLSVEIVQLKTITTALGGSINVIDENKSTPSKEVLRRIKVPMATARAFIILHKKITRYLKPVYVALAWYDGMVISMERHPLAGLGTLIMDSVTGPKQWEPAIQTNIDGVIKPMLSAREWYFDGRFMFSFENSCIDTMIKNGTFLTSDGAFRKVIAQTVDLQSLFDKKNLSVEDRGCLSFVTSYGDSSLSPPIWKNLDKVGSAQMAMAGGIDDDERDMSTTITSYEEHPFDAIDNQMAVNINFALKSGNEIGRLFGYDYVEPLQLAKLMIELHTVNLPSVAKSVKATYDCGMKFSHALAWLLGLSRFANTLETYVVMRSLLTYLTRKGIFKRELFQSDKVFREDQSVANIRLLSLDELKGSESVMDTGIAKLLMNVKSSRSSSRPKR